ncbi:hypothetical protein, partial [Leptolyngbya sp. FACHB-711]|uniref:hypothetical protein n=1 Tax=Leptolyngbya sp. FACHB-711 TaxID=2692813 RepID=UPI001A7E7757
MAQSPLLGTGFLKQFTWGSASNQQCNKRSSDPKGFLLFSLGMALSVIPVLRDDRLAKSSYPKNFYLEEVEV